MCYFCPQIYFIFPLFWKMRTVTDLWPSAAKNLKGRLVVMLLLYTAFSAKAKMALSWVALLKTGLFALIISLAVGPSKVKRFVKQY